MADPASVLHEFQHNIILVEDPIVNQISSTKIRSELCKVRGSSSMSKVLSLPIRESTFSMPIESHVLSLRATRSGMMSRVCTSQGHTVRYLLPDPVIDYIQKDCLYC